MEPPGPDRGDPLRPVGTALSLRQPGGPSAGGPCPGASAGPSARAAQWGPSVVRPAPTASLRVSPICSVLPDRAPCHRSRLTGLISIRGNPSPQPSQQSHSHHEHDGGPVSETTLTRAVAASYHRQQVMSASAKPRLAGRQPSFRGGVPRAKTRREARAERKRPHHVSRTVVDGAHCHRRRRTQNTSATTPTAATSVPDARGRAQRHTTWKATR